MRCAFLTAKSVNKDTLHGEGFRPSIAIGGGRLAAPNR